MNSKRASLIDELRNNSRRSLADIGRNTGIPLSTIFKRLNRLYNENVITRDVCIIDFAELGFPYKLGIFVSTDKRDELKTFFASVANLNTLVRISGDFDFYAELLFKDMAELQNFIDDLKELKTIKHMKTHFVTDVKQEEFRIGGGR